MSKLKYELTGGDLPQLYKNRQDPLFHYGESWELARGENWVARIEACGEIRAYKNGNIISESDICYEYKNDEELNDAEEAGELELSNNNWYEVEFFVETKHGLFYVDNMADDCVCFSFTEALNIFKDYMEDDAWCDELTNTINKELENV